MKTFTKQLDENLAFQINYTELLLNENSGAGDTIATSEWVVKPTGLTVVSDTISDSNRRTNIRVSGGSIGTYKATNTITLTSTGYTLVESIFIQVIE